MMYNQFYIYLLLDVDGSIRYVGQTKEKLHTRLSGHLYEARKNLSPHAPHRINWLRKLIRQGTSPKIISLFRCSESEVDAFEQDFIKFYKQLGCNITNHTPGGDGGAGPQTEHANKLRSEKLKGRIITKEARQKLSEAQRFRVMSEDRKEKLRKIQTGRKHGVKTIEKLQKQGKENSRNNLPHPVLQLTLDGRLVKEWPTSKQVRDHIGTAAITCCQGQNHSAYGFIWRYKHSDYIKRGGVYQLDVNGNIIQKFKSGKAAGDVLGWRVWDLLKGEMHPTENYYLCYEYQYSERCAEIKKETRT